MFYDTHDDIPPPPARPEKPKRIAGPITLTLEALLPGQCADFPIKAWQRYNPPMVCANKITRRLGYTFRYIRESAEDGERIRVWRIT